MSEKIKALPEVACFYEHDWSKYPERIKVTMSNGRVVTYRIDIPQPAPVFREKLDKFRKVCVGYEKPADTANIQPAANKKVHYIIPQKGDSDK